MRVTWSLAAWSVLVSLLVAMPAWAQPQQQADAPPPPPPAASSAPPPVIRYAPPYDYRTEHRRARPRRSRGLLIAGIALFGASYVPPAIIGLALASETRSQCDCNDAARLAIPVVGPLTLLKPDRDFNFFFNALMVTDTVLQTAGAVLLVFGIIRYAASAANDPQNAGRDAPAWNLSATPIRGGAYAALRLRL